MKKKWVTPKGITHTGGENADTERWGGLALTLLEVLLAPVVTPK